MAYFLILRTLLCLCLSLSTVVVYGQSATNGSAGFVQRYHAYGESHATQQTRFVFLELGIETQQKFQTLANRFRQRVLNTHGRAEVEVYRATSPQQLNVAIEQMASNRQVPVQGLLVHSHGNGDGLQLCGGDGSTQLCQPVPAYKLARSMRVAGVPFAAANVGILFSGCNLAASDSVALHRRLLSELAIDHGWVYLNSTYSVPTPDEISVHDDVGARGVVGAGVVTGLLGFFPIPTVLVGSALMIAESVVFNHGTLLYRAPEEQFAYSVTYERGRTLFFEGQ